MGKKRRKTEDGRRKTGDRRRGVGVQSPTWQRAIFWLTALLVAVPPFLFNPWLLLGRAYDLFYAVKDAFVFSVFVLIGGIWVLRMIWARDVRDSFCLPQSRLVRLWEGSLLLFLVLAFLSGWGSHFHLLFLPSFTVLLLGSLCYFALRCSLSTKALRSLLFLQGGMGTLVGLHILSQRVGADPVLWAFGQNPAALVSRHLYSLLGQPLVAGGYLAFCLPLTTGFLREGKGRQWLFSAGGLAVQMAGLLFTGNRGGALSALIGLEVVAILALWGQRHLLSRKRLAITAGAALLLITGLVLSRALSSPLYDRLGQSWSLLSQGKWEEAIGSRPEAWRVTTRMALDEPLLGHGLGSFSRVHAHYKLRYALPTHGELYFQAHNEYLQVWAEMGTPALLVVLVALAALLWQSVQACRQAPPSERLYRGGVCGALCSILVASFFSFPLRVSSTPIPILLVAVAVANSGGLSTPAREAPAPEKDYSAIGLRAGLTLAVVIGMVFLLRFVSAPFRASVAHTPGDRLILAAEEDRYPPEVKKRLAQAALPYYQKALALNPLSPIAYNGLGICYRHLAEYQPAKAAFEKAIEIWPAGGFYFNLALTYYDLGQRQEARQALQASELLQPPASLSAEDQRIVAEIQKDP